MSIKIDEIGSSLKDFFAENQYSKIAVLVDENTNQHCYPIIKQFLPTHSVIQIKSGEIHKTLNTCEQIWQALTNEQFDRKSLFVNLGGGVIGDMGGFCAVTYKRGIDFINIPTTLLAAVDANIGGKLGIDFNGFKNHLGFFQDPNEVFIDARFLKTLPEKELRSGFAEVIKHGLIADADYFQQVIQNGLNQPNWEAVIAHSIHIKSEVVKVDPREKGLRKILNFGHTIGHAIESFYLETENRLLHGEAIAIGMICEAYLSSKLLGMAQEDLDTITEHILQIYPDLSLEKRDFTAIIQLMYQDKKNINSFLNFSLLYEIGRAGYDIAVDENDVMDTLFYYLKH